MLYSNHGSAALKQFGNIILCLLSTYVKFDVNRVKQTKGLVVLVSLEVLGGNVEMWVDLGTISAIDSYQVPDSKMYLISLKYHFICKFH